MTEDDSSEETTNGMASPDDGSPEDSAAPSDANGHDDDSDDGLTESDAAGPARGRGGPAPDERYDPLRAYDPEREFQWIMEERTGVDSSLAKFTSPFAKRIILAHYITAGAVVWSAAIMPFVEAIHYCGLALPTWLRLFLILGVPLLVFLGFAAWRYHFLMIALRWVHVRLVMYIDDDVANRLMQDHRGYGGAVNDMDEEASQEALLHLLRLRMRAFNNWMRIGAHPFIFGIGMRGPLTDTFFAPRLYVAAAPVLTFLAFISLQIGVVMGQGAFDGTGVFGAIGVFLDQVYVALTAEWVPILPGVLSVPVAALLAAGFALAFQTYRMAVASKHFITAELGSYLKTDLEAWTHDCSRIILRRHRFLLKLAQRIMTQRGYVGGDAGGWQDLTD